MMESEADLSTWPSFADAEIKCRQIKNVLFLVGEWSVLTYQVMELSWEKEEHWTRRKAELQDSSQRTHSLCELISVTHGEEEVCLRLNQSSG